MKKKSKLFIIMVLVLMMSFGNTLSVYASEITSESEETAKDDYYYTGTEQDSEGNYVYSLFVDTGKIATGSQWSIGKRLKYDYVVRSTVPIYGILGESDLSNPDAYFYKIAFYNGFTKEGNPTYNSLIGNAFCFGREIVIDGNKVDESVVSDVNFNKSLSYTMFFENGGHHSTTIPMFESAEAAKNFFDNGDESGIVNKEPEIDKTLYLKNVGYTVRAENSSEYPDETFIKFTWDIDNLQPGDLLEIKTRNHYTKVGGDQVIGFHDYVTIDNKVDCYLGFYEISQTSAVKAWFKTVEHKPLIFKDYDTDMYFLRPVRGNQYGLWVRITMGRKTPTSSPHVTDVEYGDLTDEGDWIKNDDVTISEGGNHGIGPDGEILTPEDVEKIPIIDSISDLFKYLFGQLSNLISMFGQLPSLIESVIGWLPPHIIAIICAFIAIVILLRIFGR